MQIHYHRLHVVAKGANFYGDHKMYQKIYEGFQDYIDGWKEILVLLYDEQAINEIDTTEAATLWEKKWAACASDADFAIQPEIDLLTTLTSVTNSLPKDSILTLGIVNFLSAAAQAENSNLYRLKRRFNLK